MRAARMMRMMRMKILTALLLVAVLIMPSVSAISIVNINNNNNNNISNSSNISSNSNIIDRSKLLTINLPFIENVGQYPDDVRYYADTFIGRVLIYNDRIVYLLDNAIVEERLVVDDDNGNDNGNNDNNDNDDNNNNNLHVTGKDRSITKVNYFVGNKAIIDIPTYNTVVITSSKSIVELKAYGNNIEKVFIVKPNKDIPVMEVNGILSIDDEGRLVVEYGSSRNNNTNNNNSSTKILFTKPIAYQMIDDRRINVDVSYKIISENRYTFDVGYYDDRYDLIIDPLLDLEASTYLGGGSYDYAAALAIDSNNNVFVAGGTDSNNFPVNGYDNTYNGNGDVFIAKFNNNLDTLIASTYLGGSDDEYAYELAIDSNNNAFVAGYTYSNDFPIVNGYDNTHNGYADVFIAKFNNNLNDLIASTYLGGSDDEYAYALAIDSNNNVFVAGYTESYDFPVNGYDNTYNGNGDAFIAKFNNNLDTLIASTYLGGSSGDFALELAIDSNNNAFVAGGTESSNFPIVNGYDNDYNGSYDVLIAKFNNNLDTLIASTYLGGSDDEYAYELAIDSNNNAFVAGGTESSNFPIVNGYDNDYNGDADAFIAKFNNDLNDLIASTYLGGSNYDFANTLAIDSNNNAFVAGYTYSNDFPIVNGYDNTYNGDADAFIAKFNNDLDTLIASTYLGGSSSDAASEVAIDSNNNAFVAGGTESSNFPIVNGYDDDYNGGIDVLIAKFSNTEPTYNLSLFEDGNLSDGVINLGEDITVKASTNDERVDNVIFRWIDPTNNEVRNVIVPISGGEASDTFTPNSIGTWTIIAEFDDGTTLVATVTVPFNVVPESILGAVGVVAGSIAMLMAYTRRKRMNRQ